MRNFITIKTFWETIFLNSSCRKKCRGIKNLYFFIDFFSSTSELNPAACRRRVVTAELLISIILFNPTAFFILFYILFILWVHFFFPNPFLLQISFRSVFSGKAGRMPTQYQVSLWTGNSIFKVQKRDFFKICVTPSLIAY